MHAAAIEWGDGWRDVDCYATGNEALIGMRLLAGNRLMVNVVRGGAVEVTPLP